MTVNNVNALSPFGAVQGSQTSVKPEEVVQERFDKLMNQMSDQLAGLQKAQTGSTAAAAAPKQASIEKAQETVQPKDTSKTESTDRAAETSKPEETGASADDAKNAVEQDGESETTGEAKDVPAGDAKTQETVEKAAEEIVNEIVNVMDIPLEKVEEVMEILGLTAVDLFEPENLKQLLLNLTDNTDELALVTDETLYGNLKELFQTVNETFAALQEELGLTPEELEVVMEQIDTVKNAPAEAETEEPALIMPKAEEPEVSVEGMKDYAVSVQKDGGTVQVKVTVDDASGEKHVSEQIVDDGKPETAPVVKKENPDDTGHRGEDAAAGQHTAGNAFLQSLTGHTEEVEVPVEQPVYAQPETNQIMDQIVEYMKINVRPETQEMEMQLHPASLGTVHVQIAAKDGVITAQFAAQNESVKAVLETQMIQLREQFEEQGIKVEAVEVTVANHAYGDQFGNAQEEAGQQNENAKKGARRLNLNLNEMEEEGLDDLDDSERIAVEMMQANGNTVDYTA